MFTSRAEYRLLLREDNADLRLMEKGYQLGLIEADTYLRLKNKKQEMQNELQRLEETKVQPSPEVQEWLNRLGSSALRHTVCLKELLRRPEIDYRALSELPSLAPCISPGALEQVEIQVKYEGYIERQQQMVEKFKRLEQKQIPQDLNYFVVPSLSTEVRQKLNEIRPASFGQASRISGITPAALSILMIYMKKQEAEITSYREPEDMRTAL
jgi:tRNA uridine 5-carboxymethylaminomethyl modification enzyme